MKFEITMASNIFAAPEEILVTYPKLKQFDLEISSDKTNRALFITLKDMEELEQLMNTIDSTNGFVIQRSYGLREEKAYKLWIYDSYIE